MANWLHLGSTVKAQQNFCSIWQIWWFPNSNIKILCFCICSRKIRFLYSRWELHEVKYRLNVSNKICTLNFWGKNADLWRDFRSTSDLTIAQTHFGIHLFEEKKTDEKIFSWFMIWRLLVAIFTPRQFCPFLVEHGLFIGRGLEFCHPRFFRLRRFKWYHWSTLTNWA